MNQLDDASPMPYGKYKGQPMQEIDAGYFHYLWQNGLKDNKQSDVADYIRRNLDALKIEYRDGIWS